MKNDEYVEHWRKFVEGFFKQAYNQCPRLIYFSLDKPACLVYIGNITNPAKRVKAEPAA